MIECRIMTVNYVSEETVASILSVYLIQELLGFVRFPKF